jgi:DNA-binding GntR family transcriptional regulator
MSIPVREPDSLLGNLAQEFGTRRLSTVDMIVRILREAIVRGVLAQGMPIRQDHIAAELGISKIPLREALSKLEGQGLVTMMPRRGAVVTLVSPAQIEEIYQVRLVLEPQVLRAAIPLIAERDFVEAERLIDQMEQGETEELGKLNWRFHRALYAPSGRELTLQILENLHFHVDRFVRLHMGLIDLSRASNAEHRHILKACRNRDVELADDLLRAHLDGIRRSMEEFFSRKAFDFPAADKAVP